MEILLHKVCGRPASRTMTLRAAGPEDAAAFYALQNEVRAAMPHPEQFVPDTLENIARYLKEDLCIGGWDGGRLVDDTEATLPSVNTWVTIAPGISKALSTL